MASVIVTDVSVDIPVYNVDGTPNEAGAIRDVADIVLRYRGHSERVQLAVTRLGKQKLILGYSWLRKHNPEIDWDTQEVKMSRCPAACTTCRDEVRAERRVAKAAARILRSIRSDPFPVIRAVDTDDDPGNSDDPEELPEGVDLTGFNNHRRTRAGSHPCRG